jgi:hypothetical protein
LAKLPVFGFDLSEMAVHIELRRDFHKDRPSAGRLTLIWFCAMCM